MPELEACRLPVSRVLDFIVETFTALGVPPDDARTCAEVLIAADLRGIESHGIGRLRYYYDRIRRGQHQPVTRFEIVREGPATALVDGHHGMGHVIAVRAMRLALDKAKECGNGAVAVRNSTHYGIAGYYPLMAVREGMIGLTTTNARPAVAPTFSVQPMLGTNPIAFGAPTDEEDRPFLFDAATSIVQRGKYEVLEREGSAGVQGWAVDEKGEDLTDARVVLAGLEAGRAALLPIGGAGETHGGHKGYGLATMVEILSAALAGGAFMQGLLGFDAAGGRQPYRVGHFFLAIDISRFAPLEEFKRIAGEILRQLRAAEKWPGCTRIYAAGEQGGESEERVRRDGIPILPELQGDLSHIRRELSLSGPSFPWEI